MNAGDMEALLATLAEDAVSYEPVGTTGNKGHVALKETYEAMGSAFNSMSIQVDSLFVTGKSVAIKWLGQGILKNDQDFAFEGIDVHEFNDAGKIQIIKGYFDPAPLMLALGK